MGIWAISQVSCVRFVDRNWTILTTWPLRHFNLWKFVKSLLCALVIPPLFNPPRSLYWNQIASPDFQNSCNFYSIFSIYYHSCLLPKYSLAPVYWMFTSISLGTKLSYNLDQPKEEKVWLLWNSEWLLLNANSAIFQLYHDENMFLLRWWGSLCTRPTRWVGFL